MFEINLVPDVKMQSLHVQRIRNIIFIVCVMVMIAFGIILAVLWGIKGGQDIRMSSQDESLKALSSKINEFSDLDDFLTIQNQFNSLSEIDSKRVDVARLFNIIDVLKPTNGDSVTFSEINVNLESNTISFDAQADAMVNPYIDYNVLDVFKKSMPEMKFDYGTYVNENGIEIPSVCILEVDEYGNQLRDAETDGIYAIWTKSVNGCDPESNGELTMIDTGEDSDGDGENDITEEYVKTEVVNIKEEDVEAARYNTLIDPLEDEEEDKNEDEENDDDWYVNEFEEDDFDENVDEEDVNIKIWRTPQFEKMYKKDYIDENGNISGIVHFDSQCIEYSLKDGGGDFAGRWTTTNSCNLIESNNNNPDDNQSYLAISSSSNGKDSDGNLVLKFEASLIYNPEALLSKNKHVLYIGPTGYMNLTDSALQIDSLFEEEAITCTEDDPDCMRTESEEQ